MGAMKQIGFREGLPKTRSSSLKLRCRRRGGGSGLAWGGVFHALIGCSESSNVELEFAELQREAALQGVPLDSIVLRVSGEGFETIERSLTADEERVRIQVPTGPARRFELSALRRIEDTDVPELPVFVGETEQDLVVGSNSVEIRYRAQGALNVDLQVVGGDVEPAIASLTLRDENEQEPATRGGAARSAVAHSCCHLRSSTPNRLSRTLRRAHPRSGAPPVAHAGQGATAERNHERVVAPTARPSRTRGRPRRAVRVLWAAVPPAGMAMAVGFALSTRRRADTSEPPRPCVVSPGRDSNP